MTRNTARPTRRQSARRALLPLALLALALPPRSSAAAARIIASPASPAAVQGPSQAAEPLLELDLYGAGLSLRTLPGLAVKAELRRGEEAVDSAAGAADATGLARLTWGSYLLSDGRAAIALGDRPTSIQPGDQLRILRRGGAPLVVDIPLLTAEVDTAADRIRGQAPAGAALTFSLSVGGAAARAFEVAADADGRYQLDLAGRLDLPAEGLSGQLSWLSGEAYRFRLGLANVEAEAVLAAEQLRGRAMPGRRVLAQVERAGAASRDFGPVFADAAGAWRLPLGGGDDRMPAGHQPEEPPLRLQAGDRLRLAVADPARGLTQTLELALPEMGLSLDAGRRRALGRGPAGRPLTLRLRDPNGAARDLVAGADPDGLVEVDLGAVADLGPGWTAQLIAELAPGLRALATAVLPIQRLDVGGGQVWGLAAPGTVISATLAGPAGQVKGRGQGRADDQGAWRARFAPPGGPGPFFGQLAAQPGDSVTLESVAGDPLLLTVPPLDAEADLAADLLSGRTGPGFQVRLLPEAPGAEPLQTTADGEGRFRFDLAGRMDLRPGQGLRLEAAARPGQVFGRGWVALSLTVDLGEGLLSGRATPGSAVDAQLLDAAGAVVASARGTAQDFSGLDLPADLVASLGLLSGRFNSGFVDVAGQVVRPRTGDRLRLTAGDQAVELPITDLDGAAFVEDDLVTGQAAPGQQLQIQLRPYSGPPLTVTARADDQGRFRHDFQGQVDLAYNDAVGLYVDLGGHGLRRTLSIPGLTVDLSRGQVSGASAPGARLDLGIHRQGQALLQRSLSADARGGFQLELPEGLALRAGDQLELRQLEPAGDTLRLAVPELTVEADRARNRIGGRAAPGGDLTVAAGSALQEDFAISQDWPAIQPDGSWRADLVPGWTLAPGSLVQARYRLAAGHLVIRRAVVPLLRAELGGPNACGIGAVRDAVGAELLAADGGRLSKAEGRTDLAGRFRLSFADAAGALLRSTAGQRMRATIAGETLAVDLPELALSPDWERGSLQGRGPAHSTVFLQWPARRCLEGLQRGSGLVGLMATQTDAAGRFGMGLPGPLAAGEGFDVYVPLPDGQQVFRQVYRSLLQVFIDSDRVTGTANSAAALRASLGRGGAAAATGTATADGDGRFTVHLQGTDAAPARIQAGDALTVDADGQPATVTVPVLGFDWSRGEAVAGEAPAGAALTLSLRLADGRRLDLRRAADDAGRWRFAAAEVPPRGGWTLDDITAVRATLVVAGGHQVIAQTEGFEAPPRPEPGAGGRRIFLPRISQPLGRAGQLGMRAVLEFGPTGLQDRLGSEAVGDGSDPPSPAAPDALCRVRISEDRTLLVGTTGTDYACPPGAGPNASVEWTHEQDTPTHSPRPRDHGGNPGLPRHAGALADPLRLPGGR